MNLRRWRADLSTENLAWFVKQKQITPHVPVFDKATRTDGAFSRAGFTFDAEANRHACPGGKGLIQFRRSFVISRTGITGVRRQHEWDRTP